MRKEINEYWSCPTSIYTLEDNVVTYGNKITRDSLKNRVIVFSSINEWEANQEKIDRWKFTGIAIIIGDLIELSKIIPSIELSKIERIIACRVKNIDHYAHKLLLILNYSGETRPYREIREKYTYCPLCGKSSKDYGGKKHHYPSDGTWIRDVWNKFIFEESLVDDKLFLEAIYNLYCLDSSQRLIIIKNKNQRETIQENIAIPIDNSIVTEKKGPFPSFFKDNQRLIKGDCLEVLPWLKRQKELFDLIFVDPPYNLGKSYDQYNDKQNLRQYTDWCIKWEKLSYPLLKDSGYFVILNTPLNILFQLPSILEHYEFIGDIVWDDLAVPVARKMQPTYYSIVFLGKKKGTIDHRWYQIREPIYCKRSSCIYEPDSFRESISIWSDTYRTRQKSRRWGHPCNLPEELIERIIEITQKSLDMEKLKILDFFVGVGTTTMASLRKNCYSTGVEISKDYFDTSKHRLEHHLYRNHDQIRKVTKKRTTKRFLQKLVAKALEDSGRVGKGYTTSEQVEWLIDNKIIQEKDLENFIRPGEMLKGVGKGGAPGETKEHQTQLSEYSET